MRKKSLRFLFILIVFTNYSCKKFIEDKKQDFILNTLTKGDWYIDDFTINNIDSTVLFDEYSFRFDKQGGVKYFINTTSGAGSWIEDLDRYTITTNFPAASYPVDLLNAEWKIVEGYFDFCKAKTNSEGRDLYMMLRKK